MEILPSTRSSRDHGDPDNHHGETTPYKILQRSWRSRQPSWRYCPLQDPPEIMEIQTTIMERLPPTRSSRDHGDLDNHHGETTPYKILQRSWRSRQPSWRDYPLQDPPEIMEIQTTIMEILPSTRSSRDHGDPDNHHGETTLYKILQRSRRSRQPSWRDYPLQDPPEIMEI